jgi:hypothetical protein
MRRASPWPPGGVVVSGNLSCKHTLLLNITRFCRWSICWYVVGSWRFDYRHRYVPAFSLGGRGGERFAVAPATSLSSSWKESASYSVFRAFCCSCEAGNSQWLERLLYDRSHVVISVVTRFRLLTPRALESGGNVAKSLVHLCPLLVCMSVHGWWGS